LLHSLERPVEDAAIHVDDEQEVDTRRRAL
jgi:hypothetical protein